MNKKRKLINARNITIITISIIVAIVGIVLSFVFDLYGYIGTIGGIVINAMVFFGVFGALEIDDWTIWYKRLLIKKYNDKKGKLHIKVYDRKLAKQYLELDAEVWGYLVNNNQDVIFNLKVIYEVKGKVSTSESIPVTFNYLTNGITIVDIAGKAYKEGTQQDGNIIVALDNYTTKPMALQEQIDKFVAFLNKASDKEVRSFNPDSLTFEFSK